MWHRRELTPERVERGAVEPARAALEALRVDEMRRSDLRDVHLELRMLAHEHAGRTRMVEMDVAEQEMTHVAELQPVLLEAALERSLRRRRP